MPFGPRPLPLSTKASRQASRAKLPISNKLLGTRIVKFPSRSPPRRNARLRGLGCSIMRHLFATSLLTRTRRTLLGVAGVAILVFGVCAFLKVTSGGRQPPANELITGSIPRAAPVRKPPSNDQMAAFLSPASTQLTALVQSTAMDRSPIPLPRPRPKRL
jgi:hypothetical protein